MTLVLGASTNPSRYSNVATERLLAAGHDVLLLGARVGEIYGLPIETDPNPDWPPVDTVTLYLGPARQVQYYSLLVDELKPRRLIFNPGTENAELAARARQAGIDVEVACTLVMLSTGQY